jgi:hypothetical protein
LDSVLVVSSLLRELVGPEKCRQDESKSFGAYTSLN